MFNFILILFTLYITSKEYPQHLITDEISLETNNINIDDKLEEITDCSCQLAENICNYHCCCDSMCDENLRKEWKKQNLCIDEKNSLNKAPYTCIKREYFLFKMKNKNIRKRRGFEIRDDDDKSTDYCFQIDNSGYQTEKYSKKLINKVVHNQPEYDQYLRKIFTYYVESEILDNSNSMQYLTASPVNDQFSAIYFEGDNDIFIKDNYFIVYGPDLNGNCIPIPVQFYKRISQSKCRFEGGIQYSTITNSGIKSIKPKKFWNINNIEEVEEEEAQLANAYIVEIEFVLVVNKETQTLNIQYSHYNFIYSDNNCLEITFNVRFQQYYYNTYKKDEGNLQSGRIGYSIGQPLIVYTDDKYNNYKEYGYVIYGKNSDNRCLLQNETNRYNLEYDKPILFGENFIYSCYIPVQKDFENIKGNIQSTFAYQIMSNLRINYLGSPLYQMKKPEDLYKDDENINNLSELLDKKFTQFKENNPNKYPNIIKLNIYVDSIGQSDGPIYKINYIEPTINGDDDIKNVNNFYINFEIDFIFLNSAKDYKTSGSVLPKMPTDIIQPFVELDI